ncbi:MAG: hypothetical protein CL920_26075 [Deltaproteobacteria bacterium]|nr:hypothetical protein [Deltaproteobacteria bacterium]
MQPWTHWYEFIPPMLAFFFLYYLSVILHELGHAVAGWLTGGRVVAIGMGNRDPLLQFELLGVRCFVGRNFLPGGGIAYVYYPQTQDSTYKQVILSAGGPLVHLLLLGLSLAMCYQSNWSQPYWVMFAWINALAFLINAIPLPGIPLPGLTQGNDGWHILTHITSSHSLSWPGYLPSEDDSVLHQLGEKECSMLLDVHEILGCKQWGADELAIKKWNALPQQPPTDPYLRAHYLLTRAHVTMLKGTQHPFDVDIDEAEHLFSSIDDLEGRFFAQLTRIEHYHRRGERRKAEEAWSQLPSLSSTYTNLSLFLDIEWLRCLLYEPTLSQLDKEELQDNAERLSHQCSTFVPPDLTAELAQQQEVLMRWDIAEQLYEQYIVTLEAWLSSTPSVQEKIEYIRPRRIALTAAQRCFQRRGNDSSARKVQCWLQSEFESSIHRPTDPFKWTRKEYNDFFFALAILGSMMAFLYLLTLS